MGTYPSADDGAAEGRMKHDLRAYLPRWRILWHLRDGRWKTATELTAALNKEIMPEVAVRLWYYDYHKNDRRVPHIPISQIVVTGKRRVVLKMLRDLYRDDLVRKQVRAVDPSFQITAAGRQACARHTTK